VLPGAKVAIKAKALRNLVARENGSIALLPVFGRSQVRRYCLRALRFSSLAKLEKK
jgi:hypothetical protein